MWQTIEAAIKGAWAQATGWIDWKQTVIVAVAAVAGSFLYRMTHEKCPKCGLRGIRVFVDRQEKEEKSVVNREKCPHCGEVFSKPGLNQQEMQAMMEDFLRVKQL